MKLCFVIVFIQAFVSAAPFLINNHWWSICRSKSRSRRSELFSLELVPRISTFEHLTMIYPKVSLCNWIYLSDLSTLHHSFLQGLESEPTIHSLISRPTTIRFKARHYDKWLNPAIWPYLECLPEQDGSTRGKESIEEGKSMLKF